jgi:hypothetical protein
MLAGSNRLARAKEIRSELLMIFGTKDPHVLDAGRETPTANKVRSVKAPWQILLQCIAMDTDMLQETVLGCTVGDRHLSNYER